MAETSIEWCDAVWNPVRGCSMVSAGCERCYAMKQAHRFNGKGQPYEGLTVNRGDGPKWTGEVRCVPEKLGEPLTWKKPRRVFVNSMSDLFHEDVPDEFIDQVFAVMAIARHHTFQILTKRPERMAEYMSPRNKVEDIYAHWHSFSGGPQEVDAWPLPNVWLGTSVENQATADERIPHLLKCPAAVRFLSVEPLLEAVNIRGHLMSGELPASCECGHGHGFTRCPNYGGVSTECHIQGCQCSGFRKANGPKSGLHWIICGGESGPGARPCALHWIRSIVSQCKDAGVACFVKQLGAKPFSDLHPNGLSLKDKKGGDMAEWYSDLQVRDFPSAN